MVTESNCDISLHLALTVLGVCIGDGRQRARVAKVGPLLVSWIAAIECEPAGRLKLITVRRMTVEINEVGKQVTRFMTLCRGCLNISKFARAR